jgi:hypothetical protein
MQELATGVWTRYDTSNGLQTYAQEGLEAEAKAVATGRDGRAWIGAYGTRDMKAAELVNQKPYWPAVLNTWQAGSWSDEVFERAGWVSSLALDPEDRLWVATSRGGLARDSIEPESWLPEHGAGGLRVKQGAEWFLVDVASNGIPADDVSVVVAAPDGAIWIGTEGWGLARFQPGEEAPTPTPTVVIPSPTPTLTPSATPTFEPTATRRPVTATPTGPTATRTRRPTPTGDWVRDEVFLPISRQSGSFDEPTPAPPTRERPGAAEVFLPWGRR